MHEHSRIPLKLRINDQDYQLEVDPRTRLSAGPIARRRLRF